MKGAKVSYTGSICWILLCVLPNALAVPIVSSVTTTPTTLDRSTLLDWLGAQLSRTAETTPGLARRMQTVAGADDLTMRHLRDRGKSLLDVLLATPGAEADAVARAAKLEVCHEVPLMRGGPNFFWLKRETTTDSAASLEPLKTLLQTLQTSVAKGVERLLTAEIAPYPKGPYKQFTYTNRYSPAGSPEGRRKSVYTYNPLHGIIVRHGEVQSPTQQDKLSFASDNRPKEFMLESAEVTAEWNRLLRYETPNRDGTRDWEKWGMQMTYFAKKRRMLRFVVDHQISDETTLAALKNIHNPDVMVLGTHHAGTSSFETLLGTLSGTFAAQMLYMYDNHMDFGDRTRRNTHGLGRKLIKWVTVVMVPGDSQIPTLIWEYEDHSVAAVEEIKEEIKKAIPPPTAGGSPSSNQAGSEQSQQMED